MGNLRALVAAFAALSALLGPAAAHPGEEHSADKVRRGLEARDLAEAHARAFSGKCVGTSSHTALQARAAARRSTTAQLLREKRGIVHSTQAIYPVGDGVAVLEGQRQAD